MRLSGVCTFRGCGRPERCAGLCKTHNAQRYRGAEVSEVGSSSAGKFKPHRCHPHPSIPGCFEVELTRGQIALVDARHIAVVCAAGTPGWLANFDPCTGSYYAARTLRIEDGRRVRQTMHRLIGDLEGFDPTKQVDHIHHDTLDNRGSELREATRSQNHMNQRMRSDNRARVKGVHMRGPGLYRAVIKRDGKNVSLGQFVTAEEAGAAYAAAAKEAFGAFAHTPEMLQ